MIFKFLSGFGMFLVYMSSSPNARSPSSLSGPSRQVQEVKGAERNSDVALAVVAQLNQAPSASAGWVPLLC